MRRSSGGLRFGWGCWLAVAAAVGPLTARQGAAAEPARWIGRDAAVYLELARPGPLADRLLDPQIQKALRAIPPYAKAIDSGKFAQARKALERVASTLDTTWEQGLRDLTGGGIVLAVEGTPPRLVLMVTPTDPAVLERAVAAVRDLARDDAAARGNPDPIRRDEYRGVPAYALPQKGAYAIVEGRLVVADGSPALKAVIDRAVGGEAIESTLAGDAAWTARREQVTPDVLGWGFARLDRLRTLDPKRFVIDDDGKPRTVALLGSWLDVFKQAGWASATLRWSGEDLAAELTLPAPAGGVAEPFRGFVPAVGSGTFVPLEVPGTIASLSLWRDVARVWEARAELFPPEVVQNLAKLDGLAGQFFGGRDFGSDVLGALGNNWRLIVARQDYDAMKPVPDTKLPAFALVADLKPDDNDFARRLKVAFQTVVGLTNVAAAQSKTPPLELGSETFEGVTITTTRFMLPKDPPAAGEPVNQRHNFSPSVVQVDDHFVLSSSLGLTRALIRALKQPTNPAAATLVLAADGPELARLLERNQERLVMQNMLDKGHDKTQAKQDVGTLIQLLRLLGRGRVAVTDGAETVRLGINFALDPGAKTAAD